MVTLRGFSAFLFYILAGSFFIAYLLLRNGIQPVAAAWWLQRGDLPLIGSAFLFGGISFYHSFRPSGEFSLPLFLTTLLPLLLLLALFIVLNFWDVLPLPQGQAFL
ncbi:MAG: hypothetical protein V1926_05910 [Candidatus Peregrinibacteria bacterium]